MDLKKIKTLLEKYYNGETTLDEEKILREYFSKDDIDIEFIADKDIFLFNYQENKELDNTPDLSEEIWNKIQKSEKNKPKKNNNLTYNILRIAAGIVILLGSFLLLKDQVNNKDQNFQITDTYETPEQAYEHAKQALLYVSTMMNNGTNHLEPIKKINEGTQKLNSLSSFDNGLKKLSPINKYKIADKFSVVISPKRSLTKFSGRLKISIIVR